MSCRFSILAPCRSLDSAIFGGDCGYWCVMGGEYRRVRANSPVGRSVSVVMPFALKNLEYVFLRCYCVNAEDNAVFLVDAYTPPAAKITSKWFGISDTSRTIAVYALKEQVDAFERPDILRLPSKIFLPSVFMPDFTHEQTPRHRVIRVRRRFGWHSYREHDAQVRVCCLRSRRDRLILQRGASHVGGIVV